MPYYPLKVEDGALQLKGLNIGARTLGLYLDGIIDASLGRYCLALDDTHSVILKGHLIPFLQFGQWEGGYLGAVCGG